MANGALVRRHTIVKGSYHDNALTLRANLLALVLLTKEVLPYMIKYNHDHIISVISMSAFVLETMSLQKPIYRIAYCMR